MAGTYSSHGTWTSDIVVSTASWDTGSFTPTASTRLLVSVSAIGLTGVDISGDLTISDSQGLTWTQVGAVGKTDGEGLDTGLATWISSPVAATSTTITFDCGSRLIYQWAAGAIELAGTDATIAGYVEDASITQDGSFTVTLGATPAADDVVFYIRTFGYPTDGGWGAATVDSPYSQVYLSPGSNNGITAIGSDSATTTSISFTDASPSYAPGDMGVEMAFIVRASGASGAIAATVSTTATITGTAGGGTSLAATPSTTATVAGALGHTPNAALSTTASVAGTLGGNTALAATPSTTASVAGTVTGRTALAATPSTSASVAGALGGITALAASPGTTATISGTFDTPDNLAAAISTTATVTATTGAIVNISAALSTTAGLVVNTGNEDDYYPSPDVDEAVKSPYPPNYIPDPDEPEYINDPPDG